MIMGKDYRQIREAFKNDYREVMDRVMSALEYSEDERERTEDEVVRAIKQSINLSRLRTGKALDPRQSKPYRLANILNDPVTTSFEVFNKRVVEAGLVKVKNGAGHYALNLYQGLNWKVPFEIPEFTPHKRPRKTDLQQELFVMPLVETQNNPQEPNKLDQIDLDQIGMKTDIAKMAGDILEMEGKVKELDADLSELRGVQVATLSEEVSELREVRGEMLFKEFKGCYAAIQNLQKAVEDIRQIIATQQMNQDIILNLLKVHRHADGKTFVEIQDMLDLQKPKG